jgi:uncharacterized protein in mobD 3'region
MKLQESWKKRLKKWQGQNKKSLVEWWDKKSSSVKVLCAAILSAIIFLLIYFAVIKNSSENSVGSWNFIILIVSSPVAFVIWQFRDENSRQQIENQRKDINLKEFQKLSEWVSGVHLPEIKIVEKSITKSSFTTDNKSDASPKKITEQTEECAKEYGQKSDIAHSNIFGKQDGAIALQISAIYNLLPFFRGDYGESFRLPAFNLLKSAWQAMQQDSLNELETTDDLGDEAREYIIKRLQHNADSPMAVALAYVLLSFDQKNEQLNLHYFPEMRSNLCLAGANLHFLMETTKLKSLSGIDLSEIDLRGANLKSTNLSGSNLFSANLSGADLSNANLSGTNLIKANLSNANLERTNLFGANLIKANLSHTNLERANLSGANLSDANLANANLENTDLSNANLSGANLSKTNLFNTNLFNVDLRGCSFYQNRLWESKIRDDKTITGAKITIFDFFTQIYPYWKHQNDPQWEKLTKPEQKVAIQTFCNETDMIIFDLAGNEVAKPES